MNIAVLASGKGTNFEAIAKAVKRGYIKAKLGLLITDKQQAPVRKRAKKLGINDIFVNPKEFISRQQFDKRIVSILKEEKIDLVVLAGFMRIITPYFVKEYKHRIVNIHPAVLPSFKGVDAIRRAYRYGCKVAGVTVHFVDEKVDHGPIIIQDAVKIEQGMSLGEVEEKIHKLEHKLYPLAVKLIVEKRIKVKGRRVIIT